MHKYNSKCKFTPMHNAQALSNAQYAMYNSKSKIHNANTLTNALGQPEVTMLQLINALTPTSLD